MGRQWPPPWLAFPWAVILTLLLSLGPACGKDDPYGVKLLSPWDGETLPANTTDVTFTFKLEGRKLIPRYVAMMGHSIVTHGWSLKLGHGRDAVLCFAVVNRRVSYYQSTQCLQDPEQVGSQTIISTHSSSRL
jgi:hypothetical protein